MNQNYPTPTIEIYDPLAEELGGPAQIERFSLSIFDVAKLTGHLCPSVAGAFLATQAAVKILFKDTGVCQRGLLLVDLAGASHEGANGPIGHVISFITGAWAGDGFAGLKGEHCRRDLLRFNSKRLIKGQFRFERIDTGKVVEVSYAPSKVASPLSQEGSFQERWQQRVKDILSTPEVIEVFEIN